MEAPRLVETNFEVCVGVCSGPKGPVIDLPPTLVHLQVVNGSRGPNPCPFAETREKRHAGPRDARDARDVALLGARDAHDARDARDVRDARDARDARPGCLESSIGKPPQVVKGLGGGGIPCPFGGRLKS